ncbi:uncharacterized protein LOC124892529 [Capsicum annuum]|uniref:uncharacterized protein LOC124892529 n=1 Tax=Capsicum annuum TaxID=4072 RepID=UPI001FB07742|nr:uncharacterized protein LOC124892529 [Capsicum annuum]
MRNLEFQLGQTVGAQNTRPQGALPRDTETNPKKVNIVTTKSGLQTKETVQELISPITIDDCTKDNTEKEIKEKITSDEIHVDKKTLFLPFSQRARKYQEEDIVANKKRLTEYTILALTQECTLKIQNKLPTKLKDPGTFTLQITIEQTICARGLCDLGASINFMPTSWYRKMGLVSSKPTTSILQLADRSLVRSDGIIEDVLVQLLLSDDPLE